jgi:Protein of unknown function (DUF2892)
MAARFTRAKDMTMPRNEGNVDRALRIILGPQTPWGWVGVVPLLTGLVGVCPLYRLIGVNTCSTR